MWLVNSSIGRKLVMSITGAALVLFITFHVLMNSVALLWPTAYNLVCAFLGANWYALIATVGLAALFVIHILYALWLTLQNRRARGPQAYVCEKRPAQVEWSSKNMLVLGLVVLAFLVLHLVQFWSKMQLAEITGNDYNGMIPTMGTDFIQLAFSNNWTWILYIIGFVALWFHMNHGFWSMFQSCGWNNQTWLPRLKTIACWWVSIVVLLFIAQAVVFTVNAHNDVYNTCPALIEQRAEFQALHHEQVVDPCDLECTGECDTPCLGACEKACTGECEAACQGACEKACNGECTKACKEACTCPCATEGAACQCAEGACTEGCGCECGK